MIVQQIDHLMTAWAAAASDLPAQQIPNPPPAAPPGSEKMLQVVGYVKWIAAAALVGFFFAGIVMATVGRIWDHHGSGRLGARFITGSLGLAVLFGIGYTLITNFAAA